MLRKKRKKKFNKISNWVILVATCFPTITFPVYCCKCKNICAVFMWFNLLRVYSICIQLLKTLRKSYIKTMDIDITIPWWAYSHKYTIAHYSVNIQLCTNNWKWLVYSLLLWRIYYFWNIIFKLELEMLTLFKIQDNFDQLIFQNCQ